jgi:hypothetical protein
VNCYDSVPRKNVLMLGLVRCLGGGLGQVVLCEVTTACMKFCLGIWSLITCAWDVEEVLNFVNNAALLTIPALCEVSLRTTESVPLTTF